MTASTVHLPLQGLLAGFRRFTVAEYHNLIRNGTLTENDNLELIDGYLVHKMSRNPPHSVALNRTRKLIEKLLPLDWDTRIQDAITLRQSEPEPDIAVVRGDDDDYLHSHPVPADIGFLVEVSDSTLDADQQDKQRIYAEAGIPIYWIVNLPDRRVEVYSGPQPTQYATRTDYTATMSVPVVLDGVTIGNVAVGEILP